MSLDTEIQGSPASIEAAAAWLEDGLAPGLESTSEALVGARRNVGDGWDGAAATSFSAWSGETVGAVDDLGAGASSVAGTLRAFAASLRKAQGQMADIRGAASAAGLTVTGFVVHSPGPGPADPRAGGAPDVDAAAVSAFEAHQDKIRAWNRAVEDFEATQADVRAASVALQDDYKGLEGHNWFTNAADFLGGVGGAAMEFHAGILRGTSEELLVTARRYLETVKAADPAIVGHGKYYDDLDAATRDVKRLEDLARHADDVEARGGRMPIKLGGALAVAGIALDIATGKDPVQATASGAAGFGASVLAGAAVGTMVGGPVGTVLGAGVGVVAGVFTSGVVDSLFENGPDVGQAFDDGLEAVTDTGEAIVDGIGGAIDGIGGLFD